jgi:hypothetical protein
MRGRRFGSFAIEVIQLECPVLPTADIKGSRKIMFLVGQLVASKQNNNEVSAPPPPIAVKI